MKAMSLFVLVYLWLLGLPFSAPGQTVGDGWVAPGSYQFGSCGRVNGGQVPAQVGVSPKKYYSHSTCV